MPIFEKRTSKYVPGENFPYVELVVLLSVAFSSSLALTGLFPYIAYMVVDLHAADNVDEAGYVSGYISGAFLFGRMISSYFWGKFADRHGRLPVLYIGCVAVAVMSVVFGMSIDIYMAIFSRFLLGLFNPLAGLTKTLVSEICGPKFEKNGMALTTSAWSLGLVVGPAIGGMLSRPCEQYPATFPAKSYPLFDDFPYLLPNLFSAVIALISVILVYLYFPETLFLDTPSNSGDEEIKMVTELDEGVSLISEGDHRNDNALGLAKSVNAAGSDVDDDSASAVTTAWGLLSLPGVAMYIIAYFSVSFTAIIYDEVMPLWGLSSEEKGGVGLESKDIGQVMSIVGVPVLFFTFIGYPYLAATFGEPSCYRYGQLLASVCSLLTVFIRLLDLRNKYVIMSLIIFCSSFAHMFFVLSFTSLFLLINQSVSTANRASVNGLAMTIGSLAKGVGPMLGSILYAWSINNGLSAPMNYMFVFVLCMVVGICTFYLPVVRHVHATPAESLRHKQAVDVESDVQMYTYSNGNHNSTFQAQEINRTYLLAAMDICEDSDSHSSSGSCTF